MVHISDGVVVVVMSAIKVHNLGYTYPDGIAALELWIGNYTFLYVNQHYTEVDTYVDR
jgi:hypothetical protein